MNFTRGNPDPRVGVVAAAHGIRRWLQAAPPAVRLAVALSLAVHAMGLASLLIGSGSRHQVSDAPAASTAQTVLSLDASPEPSPEPTPPAPPSEPVVPREAPEAPEAAPDPAAASDPRPAAKPTSLFSTQSQAAQSPLPPTRLTPPTPTTADAAPRSISFAGLDAKRAERIVYVVDASGPMVSHWGWATAQLRLSLSRLDTTQKFQVLISRLLPAPAEAPDSMRGNEVLGSGQDASTLASATPASIADAVTWLSRQRLRGASDPLPGLSRALELHPDLILLLSHSFDPGLQANVSRTTEAILAELDRLNPKDAQGRRAVVIKTIQLGSEDPTGLLQAIAKQHGDGPGSYHVVTPGELERTDTAK